MRNAARFEYWSIIGCILSLTLLCACGADAQATAERPTDQRDANVGFDAGEQDAVPTDTRPGESRADATGEDVHDEDPTPEDTTAEDAADAFEPLGPPYPIVLAHGMFGFEHLANLDSVPYWYGIPEALEDHGEEVFVTEVDPLNDSYTRGEQLLEQVEEIVKATDYEKVNLVGHSQGGLDIRYVAHHLPEHIASATSIASPHGGTAIADIVLRLTDHAKFPELVDAVVQLVGKPLYDEAGDETSLFKPLRQFSEPGIEEFNRRITDRPQVYYASIAGRSDRHRGGLNCTTIDAADFIYKWRYHRDPITPLLALSESIVDGGLQNRPNDGLVRVDQAMWGDFLGCIPADHLDQVGHLLGDHPGGSNGFDHLEFFVDLADYLHDEGY